MSISDDGLNDDWPVLKIQGSEGVRIEVLDGAHRTRARGSGDLRQKLPPGVYKVRWMLDEQSADQLVYLDMLGEKEVTVSPPASFDISRIPPALRALQNDIGASSFSFRPSTKGVPQRAAAEIMLFASATHAGLLTQITDTIQLLDRDEVAMKSNKQSADAVSRISHADSILHAYAVEPGIYRLRFVSARGLELEQTVAAVAGRRTCVILQLGSTKRVVREGSVVTSKRVVGVDPDKTTILSLPVPTSMGAFSAAIRMAETLLNALAVGGEPLDEGMLARLRAPDADPYARVYAAILILRRLELRTSPAFDDPYPQNLASDESLSDVHGIYPNEKAFADRWRRVVDKLLDGLNINGLADIIAARWKLADEAFLEKLIFALPWTNQVETPPMLAKSWEWIADYSAVHPGSLTENPSMRGAARGRIPSRRWMTWKPAAAKAGIVAKASPPAPGLNEFKAALGQVVDLTVTSDSNDQPIDQDTDAPLEASAIEQLSMPTRRLVNAFLDLDGKREIRPGDAQWRSLARALMVPGNELRRRLARATEELMAVSEKREEPPALSREIVWPNDPQKGRFGGKSNRDGYVLSAVFGPGKTSGWIAIRLIVTAPPNVEVKQVSFYLHDTFRPNPVCVAFSNRQASLELMAFGGFTVGAWVQPACIELELDLATLDDAPQVIRDW